MSDITLKLKYRSNEYNISCKYRAGDGDLVFFVHGLGCSKENFSAVYDNPLYREKSLLAHDLAGFGNSCKPENFSYSMEDQAAICSQIIKRFRFERLHLVAHSMGCAVSLFMPDSELRQVKSFANLEGNLTGDDCFISRKISENRFLTFKTELYPALLSSMSGTAGQYESILKSSENAFYKSCLSLVKWSDSGDLLKIFLNLHCRRAYFHGERNTVTKSWRLSHNIPLIEIKNSGHFMMLDNPEEFYKKLYDFQFTGD